MTVNSTTDLAAVTVAAGEGHSCALTTAGGLKCWGYNDFGQLGDGTRMDRYTPVEVSGLSGVVDTVAAKIRNTCALIVTGGAKCWGANVAGELGNGTSSGPEQCHEIPPSQVPHAAPPQ